MKPTFTRCPHDDLSCRLLTSWPSSIKVDIISPTASWNDILADDLYYVIGMNICIIVSIVIRRRRGENLSAGGGSYGSGSDDGWSRLIPPPMWHVRPGYILLLRVEKLGEFAGNVGINLDAFAFRLEFFQKLIGLVLDQIRLPAYPHLLEG